MSKEMSEIRVIEEQMSDKHTITIKVKYLACLAYAYILIPVLIFFLTWLRWYVGIPAALILSAGAVFLIKKDYLKIDESIVLSCRMIFISSIIICCWVIYSGLGGMFFQTGDNHYRNAIFRDMVNCQWPVIYGEGEKALTYYLMFWIVPALFGKIGGWAVANIALTVWGTIGILLSFLFILAVIKPRKKFHILLVALFLVFWSGENWMGAVISVPFKLCVHSLDLGSFEGWLDFSRNGYDCSYLYRSNLDALCQTYNQAIVPWLITVLTIHNRKTRNFAFLGLCALPYGPIPFIGLLPVFLVMFIQENWENLKKVKLKPLLKNIFSIPNISASITAFPIFWLFFKQNTAFSVGASGHAFGLFVPPEAFDWQRIVTLLLFYFFEFGIYCIFIYPKYKKDPVFWCCIVTLILIPFFRIGTGRDFCMNASFSTLYILMIYTCRYVIEEFRDVFKFKAACRYIGLIVVLLVSTSTFIFDFAGKCELMDEWNVFPYVADDVVTLADKDPYECINFLVPDPAHTAFFKYIAQ